MMYREWANAHPSRTDHNTDIGTEQWRSGETGDQHWRVRYNTGSGELHAINTADDFVITLGNYPTIDAARRAIAGWEQHHARPDGLDWLRTTTRKPGAIPTSIAALRRSWGHDRPADQPITLMWAAKGGAGTTTTAVITALGNRGPTLIVDLAGDIPDTVSLPHPTHGVNTWLRTERPNSDLTGLLVRIDDTTQLLPSGTAAEAPGPVAVARYEALADWVRRQPATVIIDAGTGTPPAPLHDLADNKILVTRNCYLALRHAIQQPLHPTAVVLVNEPHRALRLNDVEAALGAPVHTTINIDPSISRAIDAGLAGHLARKASTPSLWVSVDQSIQPVAVREATTQGQPVTDLAPAVRMPAPELPGPT